MRLGIDASNLRQGGGLTHLIEVLQAAHPERDGITEVVVWAGRHSLERLPQRDWLQCVHVHLLDAGLPQRLYWQATKLSSLAAEACNLLFVPGGTFAGSFKPFVTMSRNMLPFQWTEMRRYGLSWMLLRLALLHRSQVRTFRRADGLIFLTEYARSTVTQHLHKENGLITTIPHGVGEQFYRQPRPQKPIESYSPENPFRILYVSIVDVYKHQWHVASAVACLREMGLPVVVDFVGPAYGPALKRLNARLEQLDPSGEYLRYRGSVPFVQLPDCYQQADMFVFASSCENMPNILLEAMASGLPIASANRGPMPEVLGNAGVYFDPENVPEMAEVLHTLLDDPEQRGQYATAAYEQSLNYSWKRCADQTFAFLRQVATQ